MASASPADVTRSSPTHNAAAPPHCGERVGEAGEVSGASLWQQQQHSPLLPQQHRRDISPLSPSHGRQTLSPLPRHPLVPPSTPLHPPRRPLGAALILHLSSGVKHLFSTGAGGRWRKAFLFCLCLYACVRACGSERGTDRPGVLAWRSQTSKHNSSLLPSGGCRLFSVKARASGASERVSKGRHTCQDALHTQESFSFSSVTSFA